MSLLVPTYALSYRDLEEIQKPSLYWCRIRFEASRTASRAMPAPPKPV